MNDVLTALLEWLDAYPEVYVGHGKFMARRLATELRALLAERDALQARVPVAPTRRLREYKGVTYDASEKYPFRFRGDGYSTAASVLFYCVHEFTNADHAAIYALQFDPYEPVESVEDVLLEVVELWDPDTLKRYATRLRAAVAAEMAGEGR